MRSDVQGSGGDYGLRKANKFKATAKFKQSEVDAALQRAVGTTGHARVVGHGGGLPLASMVPVPAVAIGSLVPGGVGKTIKTLVSNSAKDAQNLAVNVVPSTVELAKTAVHDPAKAAGMLAEPYKQFFKDPKGQLLKHPLNSYLLFRGVRAGSFRAGGRVMRSGALGKGAARVASMDSRENAVVAGTRMARKRQWSPDPAVKAVQVARERSKINKAEGLRGEARKAEGRGHSDVAHELRAKANTLDPRVMRPRDVKRRMDVVDEATDVVRRQHKAQTAEEAQRIAKNQAPKAKGVRRGARGQRVRRSVGDVAAGRDAPSAFPIVGQAITRGDFADIRQYIRELEAQHARPDLPAAQKLANAQLRAQLERVVKRQIPMSKVLGQIEKYRRAQVPRTEKLIEQGVLERGQAVRAAEIPYAVRNIARTHHVSESEAAALVRAARGEARQGLKTAKRERARSGSRLRVAERQAARVQGAAALQAARADRIRQGDIARAERSAELHSRAAANHARRAGRAKAPHVVEEALVRQRAAEGRAARAEARVRELKGQEGREPHVPLARLEGRRAAVLAAEKRQVRAREAVRVAKAEVRQAGGVARPGLHMDGRLLETTDIMAHRTTRPVGEPAPGDPIFISHRPAMRGPGNYFKHWFPAKGLPAGRRTGEAVTRGTHDASVEAAVEQLHGQQSLIDAVEGIQRFAHESAVLREDGSPLHFSSGGAASEAARNVNALHPGAEVSPVNVAAWGTSRRGLEEALNAVAEGEGPTQAIERELAEASAALKSGAERTGPGRWILVPRAALEREYEQMKVMGPRFKGLNSMTTMFRKAVLATNPKWATGNVIEAMVRSGVDHAGIRSWLTWRKVMAEVERQDPALAEWIQAQAIGHGGHFASVERYQRHVELGEYADSALPVRAGAKVVGTLEHAPIVNLVPRAWHTWTRFVFGRMAQVESQFKMAMAGAYIRREFIDNQFWVPGGGGQKAIEQAVQGLRDTAEQQALYEHVADAYGKYEAWSPALKEVIGQYTPFLAWTYNALRFLTYVLPSQHPVIQSLAVAVTQAEEEWRKKVGLDYGSKGAVPGWLMGTFPGGQGLGGHPGDHVPLAHYTPWGIGADPLGSAAGLFTPQFRDVLNAMQGKDWKGDDLPKGTSKLLSAGDALLGSTAPIYGQTKRAVDKGPNRGFNPFAPYPAKKSKGGATVVRGTGSSAQNAEIQQAVRDARLAGKRALSGGERDEVRAAIAAAQHGG